MGSERNWLAALAVVLVCSLTFYAGSRAERAQWEAKQTEWQQELETLSAESAALRSSLSDARQSLETSAYQKGQHWDAAAESERQRLMTQAALERAQAATRFETVGLTEAVATLLASLRAADDAIAANPPANGFKVAPVGRDWPEVALEDALQDFHAEIRKIWTAVKSERTANR